MQRIIPWMLLMAFAIPLCLAGGKTPTTAKKTKGLVFSKPFFSSNLMDTKGLLESDDIIETEFDDCPDPKTEATSTEGQCFECTQNDAATATREQSTKKPDDVMTDPGAQAKGSTSKTEELSLTHNVMVSSTQEDTTAATIISQKETTVSSTQEETTAATTTSQIETSTVSSTQEETSATTTTSQNETSTVASTQEETTTATTTPQIETSTVSSTQEETTTATTTSQVETSTVSSTREETTATTTPSSPNTTLGRDFTWWKEVGHAEYMISMDKMTFDESKNFCHELGAEIAVLNTTNVQKAIQNITNAICHVKYLWIGLIRDQTNKNLFKWLNHQDFSRSDSSWKHNQPNNNNNNKQNCVASFRSEDWRLNDKQCTNKYYALCQRQKPDQADCNGFANWTFGNNSWYKFFPTKMAWDCAKSVCASYCNNTHLVFIETDEENHFITETVVTDWSKHIWIGLKNEGDIWKWYNKTAIIQTDGERELRGAENTNNENCVCLKKESDNVKWKRKECTNEYFFICEAEK